MNSVKNFSHKSSYARNATYLVVLSKYLEYFVDLGGEKSQSRRRYFIQLQCAIKQFFWEKKGVFDCYGPAVLHTEKGRLDLGVHYFPDKSMQVLREWGSKVKVKKKKKNTENESISNLTNIDINTVNDNNMGSFFFFFCTFQY